MSDVKPESIDPAQRLCPLLSLSSLMTPPAMDEEDGAESGGTSVVPCAGISCAWYIPSANEKGEIVGGGCAVSTLVALIHTAVNLTASRGPVVPLRRG